MHQLTMIVPFYRNPHMLRMQLHTWKKYSAAVLQRLKIIVVDDGSPEPALPIILEHAGPVLENIRAYRIKEDIPWNRHGARNLGALETDTEWLLHIDIDHVLMADAAEALLSFKPTKEHWYRLPRYRCGRADATRRKDKIPEDAPYGFIHPHTDSYLCTKEFYWEAGGYDEDYCGVLGGGMRFVKLLGEMRPLSLTPIEAYLTVFTRDIVKDASDLTLSRDTTECRRLDREKNAKGQRKGVNPIRFTWERTL